MVGKKDWAENVGRETEHYGLREYNSYTVRGTHHSLVANRKGYKTQPSEQLSKIRFSSNNPTTSSPTILLFRKLENSPEPKMFALTILVLSTALLSFQVDGFTRTRVTISGNGVPSITLKGTARPSTKAVESLLVTRQSSCAYDLVSDSNRYDDFSGNSIPYLNFGCKWGTFKRDQTFTARGSVTPCVTSCIEGLQGDTCPSVTWSSLQFEECCSGCAGQSARWVVEDVTSSTATAVCLAFQVPHRR